MKDIPKEVIQIIEDGKTAHQCYKYEESLTKFEKALFKLKSLKIPNEIWYLNWQIGKLKRKLGEFEEGKTRLNEALKQIRKMGDNIVEARILNDIGLIYKDTGENFEALDYYEKSFKIFDDLKEISDMCIVLSNISMVFLSLSRYDDAQKKLKEADDLWKNERKMKIKGYISNNFGVLYSEWGKHKEVARYLYEALEIWRELGNLSEEANTLHNLGGLYSILGNNKKSKEYYEESLNLKLKLKERNKIIATLASLGVISLKNGENDEANHYFDESLRILSEIENLRAKVGVYISLGTMFQEQGFYSKAEECFNESLKTSIENHYKKPEASSLNGLGTVFYSLGDFSKSIKFYEKAIMIQEEINNQREQGATLNNLALVYYHLGFIDKSIQHYITSLSFVRIAKDRFGEASVYDNLGHIYHQLGRYEEALDNHKKALEIFRKIPHKGGIGRALNNMGVIFRAKKEFEEAETHFEEALRITQEVENRKGEASILDNIAFIRYLQKNHEESYKLLNVSLDIRKKIKDKRGIASSFNQLGNYFIHAKKNPKRALKYYRKSLVLNNKIGNKKTEAATLQNIADLYAYSSKYIKSVKYLKKSLELKDFLTSLAPSSDLRISYRFETLENTLNRLISCFIKLEYFEEALQYVDFNKGREIQRYRVNVSDEYRKQLSPLTREFNQLSEEMKYTSYLLNHLNSNYEQGLISSSEYNKEAKKSARNLKKLQNRRSSVQRKIWFDSPTYGVLLPSETHNFVKEIQSKMNPDWIILEYYYNSLIHEMYIFIIEDNKLDLIKYRLEPERLGDITQKLVDALAEYKNTVLHVLENLVNKELPFSSENIKDEMNWYSNKIEKKFDDLGKKHCSIFLPKHLKEKLTNRNFEFLTIIPTGIMHSYPLEIIHDGDDYWGLKYSISRAFNLQNLIELIRIRKIKFPKRALLVGNPTEGIKGGLKDATEEVKEISVFLENNNYNVDLLLENDANLSDFLEMINSNHYSIIHFAGHAEFVGENPNLSSLYFREDNEIVKLYANMIPLEISSTNSNLIALSACETGILFSKPGDEIFGLLRGFMETGIFNIILTGWEIYDNSAKEFFIKFYESYQQNQSVSQSLQEARHFLVAKMNEKHKTKKEYLIHWGAYRLYGVPF